MGLAVPQIINGTSGLAKTRSGGEKERSGNRFSRRFLFVLINSKYVLVFLYLIICYNITALNFAISSTGYSITVALQDSDLPLEPTG